jgi:hypothetical protein
MSVWHRRPQSNTYHPHDLLSIGLLRTFRAHAGSGRSTTPSCSDMPRELRRTFLPRIFEFVRRCGHFCRCAVSTGYPCAQCHLGPNVWPTDTDGSPYPSTCCWVQYERLQRRYQQHAARQHRRGAPSQRAHCERNTLASYRPPASKRSTPTVNRAAPV